MKQNKLLFLIPLLTIGCSKVRQAPTLIGELEKSTSENKSVHRALATAGTDKCFKDILTVDVLQAEIKTLEKKFASGTKVSGTWKHLNLEELPIPQANFLKSYGNRLGDLNNPEAFDYSECSDVPCIINKIYEKENHIAGYVHYLWYLKMGSYLAANNSMYGGSYKNIKPGIYNNKNFEVSSYLWSEGELSGFWQVTHLAQTPFTELHNVMEINRVPRGEYYGFLGPLTCGLAWSTGWVSFQDGCLDSNHNLLSSVLHELSHQLDFLQGKKLPYGYRSKQPDYQKIARYSYREYKNDKNEIVEEWTKLPDFKWSTKPGENYGATSGVENFAETLSMFRVDGSKLKDFIHEDHYQFASKNYYAQKSFDEKSLIKQWQSESLPLMAQLAFKAVGDCSNSKQAHASKYFTKADFTVPVLPSMLNCLGARGAEISKEVQAKVKLSAPQGCGVLDIFTVRERWEPEFKPQLSKLINKYLNEINKDKSYYAKIQTFYDDITNKAMATSAYLSCYGEEVEGNCYQQAVLKAALDKLAPLALPEAHAQNLAQLYLDTHSLTDIQQHVLSTYRSLVASHREITDEMARETWDACLALPVNDEAPPTGKLFTIGEGYMVSSLYNCLNMQFPTTAKNIVREMSVNGRKVQHPKEEVILHEQVIPELKNSLLAIFSSQAQKELEEIEAFIKKDTLNLRKQMLSDFSWVKDVIDTNAIQADCKKQVVEKIDLPVRFHIRAQAFLSLSEEVCRDIQQSPQYSSWLQESQSVFEDKSLEGLQNKILTLASVRAQECLATYPVDSNLNRIKFKKEREACLIGEWPSLEKKAIEEFSQDPLVVKFKIDVSGLKSKLEPNRRRHQLRIMKEYF